MHGVPVTSFSLQQETPPCWRHVMLAVQRRGRKELDKYIHGCNDVTDVIVITRRHVGGILSGNKYEIKKREIW